VTCHDHHITELRRRVRETIQRHNLCQPHDTLIVAVSGGADSVALLDILATLSDFPLSLVVAHLNHCLRGAESDADEQFVRNLAEQYQFPCAMVRADVRHQAESTQQSLEEAGREARYRFFEELRRRYKAAAVCVAHHAEDQAETFLIRLLRGSGTSGLGCMPYKNNRHIIRPLLDISRSELRRYLAAQKQSWREDASNLDHSFLRNRIRHQLLPLLEEYAPAVAHRLAATAHLLRQDDELLTQHLEELFPKLVKRQQDGFFFAADTCCRQTEGMRLRLYRHAVETLAGSLRSFGLDHFRQIDRLLFEGRTGALLPLPKALVAIKTADGLLISLHSSLSPQLPPVLQLPGPGTYDLGNGMVLLAEGLSDPPEPHNHAADSALVDLDAAPFPWLVRPWRSTDRLILHGGSGSRAAGRILIDLKIPRHLRPGVPLLLKEEHPLWLVGVKRSGHACVSSRSTRVIKLTISGATDAAHPP